MQTIVMQKVGAFLILLLFPIYQILGQSTEIKLSSGLGFDGEPNMVANPNNPRQMVVAWMGLGLGGSGTVITIRTRSSSDGGKTWSNIVSLPHFSDDWGSADPTMVYHHSGKLYLSYIDYRQAEDSGGLFLFSSTNNGASWNFESKISDAQESPKLPVDRPWLAIDNSGGSYDGTLYVTTKPAPWIPAPNRPYIKVSSDAKNWSTLRFLDTTGFLVGNFIQAPMASPGVTKNGSFVAAFPSYVPAQSLYPKFFVVRSNNKGSSYSYNDLVVNPGNSGDTLLKSGYLLLPDPYDDNRMVFARLDNKAGDADIVVNVSLNKGVNWAGDVRVNDDTPANGKLQDLVWASWGKTGELALCWRDRRHGSGTGFAQDADCYCAVSTDSGRTFGKNLKMTAQTAAFHAVLNGNGNDFMSCHLNGDTLIAVWGDIRNNKLEIWTSSIAWRTQTSAVQELLVSEDLPPVRIWPVPATNELKLKAYYTPVFPWYLVDASGKRIKEITQVSNEILDISSLVSGVYYLTGNTSAGPFQLPFEVSK